MDIGQPKWSEKMACALFGSPETRARLKRLDEIAKDYNKAKHKISQLLYELETRATITKSVIETVPDWCWYKDINGRYVHANKAIRDELFCGMSEDDVIGRNDVELATELKEIYGDENHTFGQLCANSDAVVYSDEEPTKFYEMGLVRGKMLRVIVHKDVLRNKDGEVIGTCGTGRNVTDDIHYLQDVATLCTDKATKKQLEYYMERNKFTNNKSNKDC